METYNMANFSNDQWQEAMVSIANTGISTTPPTDVVSTTGSPITADQGVVSANFGAGVASWSAEATGTFSAGTTLFFEFQLTGSGSWYPAFGVPIGSTSDVAVSSVVGGAPITYQGNAAGFQAFRVRAHPFAGGDSVTVKIVGSLATDGGFVRKSLPPGTNSIGAVTANAGTNLNTSTLALESGGNLAASKADLDTIVTNTNKIPASPATEGGNLATIVTNTTGLGTQTTLSAAKTDLDTIAGAISSNKIATKAASGDFADGAIATIGAQADASAAADNSTASFISLFKRLLAKFPVIGTQTSANSSSVVIASDQANVPVKGGFVEQASLTAGSLNADLVPSTDVSAYKGLSLHINTNAYSGTLTIQSSNDNTNWISTYLYRVDLPGYSVGSSTAVGTNIIMIGGVNFRYFRVRMTTYTSGTAQGTLELFTVPPIFTPSNFQALQSGVWTAVPNAATTGGSTPYHLVSAASTNATTVKGSAGQVYNYNILNTNAAIRYVHLYNKASNPSVGTDVPVKTFQVPATGQIAGSFPVGSTFAAGVFLFTTGKTADKTSGAVCAGDVIICF